MAKDVDLSSKEWRDIVFEGKNKEFGAYVLRAGSVQRHTRAVLYMLAALAVVLVLLVLSLTGVFSRADDDETAIATEQELVTVDQADDIDEEIEEEQFVQPEPEEEIITPEEVANEQRVTDILIVQDEEFEEDKQVRNQEETLNNEAQFGSVDVTEGTNDLNKQTITHEVIQEAPVEVDDEPMTMAMVEQKPMFPGGDEEMYKWLSSHINYPAAASEEGVQGRVVVQFVVSKTGSIENVQVVRPRHPALDKEAVRVVKAMPKWVPGRNNGQPVKVTYTLPVTFKLQQ